MPAPPGQFQKLQSHASGPNNYRIVEMYQAADQLALQAQMNFHIVPVKNFFAWLEQICIAVSPILSEPAMEEINATREGYYKLTTEQFRNPALLTAENLDRLLRYTRRYQFLLTMGVDHTHEFFFRKSIVTKKGLSALDFFQDSIFGGVKKDENKKRD